MATPHNELGYDEGSYAAAQAPALYRDSLPASHGASASLYSSSSAAPADGTSTPTRKRTGWGSSDYDAAFAPAQKSAPPPGGNTGPRAFPYAHAVAAPGAAGLAISTGSVMASPSATAVSHGARDAASTPTSASRYGFLDSGAQLSAAYSNEMVDLDDDLHRFGPDDFAHKGKNSGGISSRGVLNLTTLAILILALLMLFAGYPILTAYQDKHDQLGGFGPGGTNGSGQISSIPGVRTSLIDPDTPQDAYTRQSGVDSTTMNLVFSDEFNTPGRSFYPGDDPFWEAVDLHYWATNNYEWYDPAAVTTANGALRLTISQHPEHNLNFRGGMIQSWNKFCFTGGVLVAGVRLPGKAKAAGLWPAVWLMGNLGRAGYGATLEGTWPYSYDACDLGTLPNQTDPHSNDPDTTTLGNCPFNQKHSSKSLSFLPGQRLSACTCPGDDHPGPQFPNGSYAGRMAPEIDLFEAQVNQQEGMTVSQSCQFAPYNAYYRPTAKPMLLDNRTIVNSYTGELTQQSMSGVTPTNQQGMQYLPDMSTGIFTDYAVEYQPGQGGHVQWWSSGVPAWRLTADEIKADPVSKISARPVPPEPMYILANVGISQNFGIPSWKKLVWPSSMEIDYIRVYQAGKPNVGCDPPDYPTAAYIARHQEAYTNPNFTLWGEGGYGADWPRNRLNPGGCQATLSKNPGSPTQPIPKAKIYPSNAIGNGQQECQINDWNKGQQQN